MASDVATYPITGIPHDGLPRGEVPLRVEVDDFYTGQEYAVQRNLFLLAMAKFEAMDPDTKLSYFQVAGIHGMPHQTWDDPKHPKPAENGGYCPHNLVTFPTWHRPHLLLFEQRVFEIMVQDVIPTQFDPSEHEQLNAEARKWRLPYWDWAAKKQRTSDGKAVYDAALILKDQNVTVTTSAGETSIPNPMYQFTTAPVAMEKWGVGVKSKGEPIEYQRCTTTSKHPPVRDVTGWIDGVQNVDALTDSIRKGDSLGEAVNRLFSGGYVTEYRKFATARYEPDKDHNPRDALSLEGIHNNLHLSIGGNFGHMALVPVAAFDPIFWMHHANVDRIFAIYQALNASESDKEKSWWVSDTTVDWATDGDFPTPQVRSLTLTPKTPLSPFHSNDKGTTYDSNGVRHVADLGYTYPELQRWKFADGSAGDAEFIASIRAGVNTLYPVHPLVVTSPEDYVVNVVYQRSALGGYPYTVEILLQDLLVGSVYNFSAAQNGGCENCAQQEQAGILSSSQVTLTGALLATILDPDSALTKWDKDTVAAYVERNLRRRVLNVEGTEVEMPSLKVSVAVGSRKISKISKGDDGYTLEPIKGNMRSLPTIFGGVEESEWKPVEGQVQYGDTVTDKEGAVYDVLEITKEGSLARVALTGYSEYVEVLSI